MQRGVDDVKCADSGNATLQRCTVARHALKLSDVSALPSASFSASASASAPAMPTSFFDRSTVVSAALPLSTSASPPMVKPFRDRSDFGGHSGAIEMVQ